MSKKQKIAQAHTHANYMNIMSEHNAKMFNRKVSSKEGKQAIAKNAPGYNDPRVTGKFVPGQRAPVPADMYVSPAMAQYFEENGFYPGMPTQPSPAELKAKKDNTEFVDVTKGHKPEPKSQPTPQPKERDNWKEGYMAQEDGKVKNTGTLFDNGPAAAGTGGEGRIEDFKFGHSEANARGTSKPGEGASASGGDGGKGGKGGDGGKGGNNASFSHSTFNAQGASTPAEPSWYKYLTPGMKDKAIQREQDYSRRNASNLDKPNKPGQAQTNVSDWSARHSIDFASAMGGQKSILDSQITIEKMALMQGRTANEPVLKAEQNALIRKVADMNEKHFAPLIAKRDLLKKQLESGEKGKDSKKLQGQLDAVETDIAIMQAKMTDYKSKAGEEIGAVLNMSGDISKYGAAKGTLADVIKAGSRDIERGDTSASKKHGWSWTSNKLSGDEFREIADATSDSVVRMHQAGASRFAFGDENKYTSAYEAFKKYKALEGNKDANEFDKANAFTDYEFARTQAGGDTYQKMLKEDPEAAKKFDKEMQSHFEQVHTGETKAAEAEEKGEKADNEKKMADGFVAGAKLMGTYGKAVEAAGNRMQRLNISKGTMGQG